MPGGSKAGGHSTKAHQSGNEPILYSVVPNKRLHLTPLVGAEAKWTRGTM